MLDKNIIFHFGREKSAFLICEKRRVFNAVSSVPSGSVESPEDKEKREVTEWFTKNPFAEDTAWHGEIKNEILESSNRLLDANKVHTAQEAIYQRALTAEGVSKTALDKAQKELSDTETEVAIDNTHKATLISQQGSANQQLAEVRLKLAETTSNKPEDLTQAEVEVKTKQKGLEALKNQKATMHGGPINWAKNLASGRDEEIDAKIKIAEQSLDEAKEKQTSKQSIWDAQIAELKKQEKSLIDEITKRTLEIAILTARVDGKLTPKREALTRAEQEFEKKKQAKGKEKRKLDHTLSLQGAIQRITRPPVLADSLTQRRHVSLRGKNDWIREDLLIWRGKGRGRADFLRRLGLESGDISQSQTAEDLYKLAVYRVGQTAGVGVEVDTQTGVVTDQNAINARKLREQQESSARLSASQTAQNERVRILQDSQTEKAKAEKNAESLGNTLTQQISDLETRDIITAGNYFDISITANFNDVFSDTNLNVANLANAQEQIAKTISAKTALLSIIAKINNLTEEDKSKFAKEFDSNITDTQLQSKIDEIKDLLQKAVVMLETRKEFLEAKKDELFIAEFAEIKTREILPETGTIASSVDVQGQIEELKAELAKKETEKEILATSVAILESDAKANPTDSTNPTELIQKQINLEECKQEIASIKEKIAHLDKLKVIVSVLEQSDPNKKLYTEMFGSSDRIDSRVGQSNRAEIMLDTFAYVSEQIWGGNSAPTAPSNNQQGAMMFLLDLCLKGTIKPDALRDKLKAQEDLGKIYTLIQKKWNGEELEEDEKTILNTFLISLGASLDSEEVLRIRKAIDTAFNHEKARQEARGEVATTLSEAREKTELQIQINALATGYIALDKTSWQEQESVKSHLFAENWDFANNEFKTEILEKIIANDAEILIYNSQGEKVKLTKEEFLNCFDGEVQKGVTQQNVHDFLREVEDSICFQLINEGDQKEAWRKAMEGEPGAIESVIDGFTDIARGALTGNIKDVGKLFAMIWGVRAIFKKWPSTKTAAAISVAVWASDDILQRAGIIDESIFSMIRLNRNNVEYNQTDFGALGNLIELKTNDEIMAAGLLVNEKNIPLQELLEWSSKNDHRGDIPDDIFGNMPAGLRGKIEDITKHNQKSGAECAKTTLAVLQRSLVFFATRAGIENPSEQKGRWLLEHLFLNKETQDSEIAGLNLMKPQLQKDVSQVNFQDVLDVFITMEDREKSAEIKNVPNWVVSYFKEKAPTVWENAKYFFGDLGDKGIDRLAKLWHIDRPQATLMAAELGKNGWQYINDASGRAENFIRVKYMQHEVTIEKAKDGAEWMIKAPFNFAGKVYDLAVPYSKEALVVLKHYSVNVIGGWFQTIAKMENGNEVFNAKDPKVYEALKSMGILENVRDAYGFVDNEDVKIFCEKVLNEKVKAMLDAMRGATGETGDYTNSEVARLLLVNMLGGDKLAQTATNMAVGAENALLEVLKVLNGVMFYVPSKVPVVGNVMGDLRDKAEYGLDKIKLNSANMTAITQMPQISHLVENNLVENNFKEKNYWTMERAKKVALAQYDEFKLDTKVQTAINDEDLSQSKFDNIRNILINDTLSNRERVGALIDLSGKIRFTTGHASRPRSEIAVQTVFKVQIIRMINQEAKKKII